MTIKVNQVIKSWKKEIVKKLYLTYYKACLFPDRFFYTFIFNLAFY